jgi:predicted ester cyclase
MQKVWFPLDPSAVPRFYQPDVIGHHRKQRLTYPDVMNRLVKDRPRYLNPKYDITDIIAADDKFAIRFLFSATGPAGQPVAAEANYFYHLRDGMISEFWLLADIDFDYRADS